MTDKFITPGIMPTPYESELLVILIEECAEVIQRATKVLRFGIDEIQPGQEFDNTQRLSHETGDLFAIIQKCIDAGLIDHDIVDNQISLKIAKLTKFMQQEAPE